MVTLSSVVEPRRGHSASEFRDFLTGLFEEGGREVFFEDVDRILGIDRDYLLVEFEGRDHKIADLSKVVDVLRNVRPGKWRDAELDLVCALAALGRAWVRLEYTDMVATMDAVVRYMDGAITQYCAALGSNDRVKREYLSTHWWGKASLVRKLRRQVDGRYRRIAQIDGANWHRRELLLDRALFEATSQDAEHAVDHLAAVMPEWQWDVGQTFVGALRNVAAELIRTEDTPIRLILALMQAANEDPEIDADHTTLLCPRGQNLESPWALVKDDFLAYVVFNREFVPPREAGVGDEFLIQKAVYAHHSTKKARMAKKYRAMYSPDSPASLADDLGDLGLYFNEHAHHRGHVVAGVFSAMRYLMPITVERPAGGIVIQGLTDFRVTRASDEESRRFDLLQFPACYRYGGWVREILEVAFQSGIVFPPMNASWR